MCVKEMMDRNGGNGGKTVGLIAFLAVVLSCLAMMMCMLGGGDRAWRDNLAGRLVECAEEGKNHTHTQKNTHSRDMQKRSFEKEVAYLPIDVVYTWVNGSDPVQRRALHEARVRYFGQNSSEDREEAQDSRYIDNEELRFSLRSLEAFAPWVVSE